MRFFNCLPFAGYRGWGTSGNFFSIGSISMMIGLLLVIGLIVYLIIKNNRSIGNTGNGDALQIIKTRLAKGEITKEEYDSLKQDLL